MASFKNSQPFAKGAASTLQSYVDIVDKYVITSSTDIYGRITYVSEAFAKISKYSKEELLGRSHNIVRHPDMPSAIYEDMWQTIRSGNAWSGEIMNRAKDGSAYWVDVNIEPDVDTDGNIIGYTAIRTDITAKKQLQDYVDVVDKYVITSSTDARGRITYVSEAFATISQYTKEELLGRAHNIVRHPDMSKSLYKEMWHTLRSGEAWSGEIMNRAKDGSAYWVDVNIEPDFDADRNIIGYTAVRSDITDKKQIEELSVTDRLTGLFNRLKLDDVLENEFRRYQRYQTPLSVIILDVDHFKQVNDRYGHLIGDEVLTEIADLIQNNIRACDIAGRWGGEEFLIICPSTPLEGGMVVAEKLRKAISNHPFTTTNSQTASFGVANLTLNGDLNQLLKAADDALYRAKQNGRNCVESAT